MANNLLAEAGFQAPNVSNIGHWLLYFLIAIIFAVFISFLVYMIVFNLKFNKKVILFKKIAGSIIPVGKDKGIIDRIGIAGDTWLRTKKFKKILPRPKLEMEKNTYWFFEREDGEWINFTLEDIDKAMKEAKVYYVDEDMRLQRLGIQRNLNERFNKPSFWDRYGNIIMGAFFMLIVTICLIIIFNKINDLIEAFPQLAKALENLANSIAQQRSGAVPVNATGGKLL